MKSIEEYLNDDFAMNYADGILSDKLVSFMGIITNFYTIQNWILNVDPSLKIGGYPILGGELKI